MRRQHLSRPKPVLRMQGFTLIEVMIAIVIMAMIAIMTNQSLTAAITSSQATQEAVERVAAVDRIWVLFETDTRNIIPGMPSTANSKSIPPVYIDPSDQYRFSLLRAGYANPLHLPRTEVVRVGYRFEDGTIWRDTWVNISDNDERQAKPQKVLEHVEDMFIKALPAQGATFSGGPWVERWPDSGQPPLPAAIEITLKLEDFGEIKRVYSVLPGIDNTLVVEPPPQSNAPNGSVN